MYCVVLCCSVLSFSLRRVSGCVVYLQSCQILCNLQRWKWLRQLDNVRRICCCLLLTAMGYDAACGYYWHHVLCGYIYFVNVKIELDDEAVKSKVELHMCGPHWDVSAGPGGYSDAIKLHSEL